jgi:hypothetical protein
MLKQPEDGNPLDLVVDSTRDSPLPAGKPSSSLSVLRIHEAHGG